MKSTKQEAAGSRAQATNQQLADELVVLAIRFTRKLRALTPPVELSGPEISALAVLVHGGRATIGELSKIEEVRSPSMTRLVQKLEARGFVHRLSDAEDRRLQWIEATPAGREHFFAGHRRRLEPLVDVLDKLSADEKESLTGALPLLRRVFSLNDTSS